MSGGDTFEEVEDSELRLVDELTRANHCLLRQAHILRYIPDPVLAIGLDGAIKFCSKPMRKLLKRKEDMLLGANVQDITVPESWNVLRNLVHDLIVEEHILLAGSDSEVVLSSESVKSDVVDFEMKSGSGGSSSASSVIILSSGYSFEQTEVKDDNDLISDSTEKQAMKTETSCKQPSISSSVSTLDSTHAAPASVTTDEEQTPKKKMKMTTGPVSGGALKVDDMTAKPSFLLYDATRNYHLSSDGHSAWSSGECATVMQPPVSPTCCVGLIRRDLCTIQCEVTASIMNRPPNDEDEELGIIDCNPKVTVGDNYAEVTKEILLCFRPHRLLRYYNEEDSDGISSSSALANTTGSVKSNNLSTRKTAGESSCQK